MKTDELKKRLQKNRPMTPVTLQIPTDVIDDLKRIAPKLGFSGYQPLMRSYIGQGLRQDLARLEDVPDMDKFLYALRRHGITEEVIKEVMAEAI